MIHHASRDFWVCYHALPGEIQKLAGEAFGRLKRDPRHPGLHFKKMDRFWSARVGRHHRALAVEIPDGLVWFWIGTQADYDRLLS